MAFGSDILVRQSPVRLAWLISVRLNFTFLTFLHEQSRHPTTVAYTATTCRNCSGIIFTSLRSCLLSLVLNMRVLIC